MSPIQDPSLTERLADWLTRQRRVGLPDDVLVTAQTYVLDWLGSALAGTATPAGAVLRAYARQQPAGPSTTLGDDRRSAEVAALVNGGLSHIVEMDDLDRGSVLHPGAVVIPAALAVAERQGSAGRDLLAAIVGGYEVAIRVGEAVGKRHYHYFHNTGTCGVFGAAAAAGWLLALSGEQLVWALGNAGTRAAGLWEFNADGAMSKPLHAGAAAATGVLAADLAACGLTGARRILEGERGLFAASAPDADPARVIAALDVDGRFKIAGVSIKPHASCRHTHPAIDAALELRPQVDGRAIERIEIDTYRAALNLCDRPDPTTPYGAKFSLQYCVASALVRGSAGLEDFAPESITAPPVLELLTRIQTNEAADIEARYPKEWPTRVRVALPGGETLDAAVSHPKGDPENALSREELEAKFRALASYGPGAAVAEGLLAWVGGLSTSDGPVHLPLDAASAGSRIRPPARPDPPLW